MSRGDGFGLGRSLRSALALLSAGRGEIVSVNEQLSQLEYPLCERNLFPFGLKSRKFEGINRENYVGDEWLGITDHNGDVCGGIYWAKEGNRFDYHGHDFEERCFVLEGSFILKVTGRPDRFLKKYDTYYIPPSTEEDRTLHSAIWKEDSVIVLSWNPPLKTDKGWSWDIPDPEEHSEQSS